MRRRRSRNHGGMPRSDLPGRRPPLRAFRAITVTDAVAGSAHLSEIGVQPSAATVRGYARSPANRLVRYRYLPFQYRADMVPGESWILFGPVLFGASLAVLKGVPLYSCISLPPGGATGATVGGLLGGSVLIVRGALVCIREQRGKNGLTVTARGVRYRGTQPKVGRRGQPHGFCRREPTPTARRQAGLRKGGCGGTWREWMGAPRERVRHSRCLR